MLQKNKNYEFFPQMNLQIFLFQLNICFKHNTINILFNTFDSTNYAKWLKLE